MSDTLKVLIIEDDPDVRLGCEQALQLEGIATESVSSRSLRRTSCNSLVTNTSWIGNKGKRAIQTTADTSKAAAAATTSRSETAVINCGRFHIGHPSVARERTRITSASYEIPATRAAIGTSEWSVMPGEVLTSSM